MSNPAPTAEYTILGAGVIGLTTALHLAQTHPDSKITIVSKHLPGDSSIEYCSPWAGANWLSVATDNGRQEGWDRITYQKFKDFCKQGRNGHDHGHGGLGKNERVGVWSMAIKACFDNEIEDSGVLSQDTGKIWYEEMVGGLRHLNQGEVPEGARWGFECMSFVLDVPRYLSWLQNQVLEAGVSIQRRSFTSISEILLAFPKTVVFNCTGLGSFSLTDVADKELYPTRGQVVFVENTNHIEKMYFRSPRRVASDTTYVFPRSRTGGIILGGVREDGNWDGQVNLEFEKDIMRRCVALCPDLGAVEDLKVLGRGVGLRPGRKGGARIEREMFGDRLVIHNYGAGGAGYQASWGMATEAVNLL